MLRSRHCGLVHVENADGFTCAVLDIGILLFSGKLVIIFPADDVLGPYVLIVPFGPIKAK